MGTALNGVLVKFPSASENMVLLELAWDVSLAGSGMDVV
jgi:hypothetical protein